MQSMHMQIPQQGSYPPRQQQVFHYAQLSQPYQPYQQQQQQQQQHYSPISRTTTAQTSNNNTSPPPQSKEKRSRRWSLAGRFFDKRKSVTQPFNSIPSTSSSISNNQQQPPLTINTTYGNSNGPYPDEQRVSPVGSGGSGGSSGSGSGHSGGSGSGNGGGGHRRSSLADIPKALFSSLRRGSHSISSEAVNKNKESVPASAQQQQRYQQQQQRAEGRIGSPDSSFEGDDNDSTAPDGDEDDQEYGRQENGSQHKQPASATILAANGLVQANMAVSKAPPLSCTTMKTDRLSPVLVKGILKKRSLPSPTAQQQQPYSKMRPNIINRSSSYEVHPMASNDGQMGGLLCATDHSARLEISSPVSSHPQQIQSQQQQQQQQKPSKRPSPGWTPAPGGIQPPQYPSTPAHHARYGSYGEKNVGNTIGTTGMPLKLGSTVELDDRYTSQGGGGGAAFPPDFTPGMQSNVYQDRGGERSQGQVLDYRMMEMNLSFSLPGDTLPPPPVAAASSAAHGYQDHPPHSQAHDQYYYGGTGGAYVEYDQNSSLMDRSQQPMTTMMHERDSGYGYAGNRGRGSYYESMRNGSGISESTMGILSGNGISHHRPRTIGFTDTIEIIPAHRKSEYNRRSDKYATFKNLIPDLKSEIRDELNAYKMREMAVHVESMGNTAFH